VASVLALLAGAPVAGATIPSVFITAQTSPAGGIPCIVQTGAKAGIRLCSALPRSTVKTFDGVPIDVNVLFPPAPATGPDGDYPVVAIFSGFPSGKIGLGGLRGGFSSTTRWLDRGYAVFSMTDRGFRESCGTSESRSADLIGCAAGYTRFVDT